jgi:hypothetical protein
MLLALLSLACCADGPNRHRRAREEQSGSVAGVVVGVILFALLIVAACLFCAGAFDSCCRAISAPPSSPQLIDSPPQDDAWSQIPPPGHIDPVPSPGYADGWGAPCQYQPAAFLAPTSPAPGFDPGQSAEPVPDATDA